MPCELRGMCFNKKQHAFLIAIIVGATVGIGNPVIASQSVGSAGGVAIGEGSGGVTDRVYVTAPPNYAYGIETARGDFLDCGEERRERMTDRDGRDMAGVRCGVTLTETIFIPAAANSARVTVHY